MTDEHEPGELQRPPSPASRLIVTGVVLIASAAALQFVYVVILRTVASQQVLLAVGYTAQAVNTALPAIGTALLGAGLVIRHLERRR